MGVIGKKRDQGEEQGGKNRDPEPSSGFDGQIPKAP
jgi:hypothetical protein